MRRSHMVGVLLLGAFLPGCCCCMALGGEDEGASVQALEADTPRTAVPEALSGEWRDPQQFNSAARSIDLFDPGRGEWLGDPDAQAGTGMRFTSDGQYVWGTYVTVGTGGCRTRALKYQQGTVAVEGASLSLHPSVHRQKYEGGCSNNVDSDTEQPLTPLSGTWATGVSSDGRQVLQLSVDGSNLTFVRP